MAIESSQHISPSPDNSEIPVVDLSNPDEDLVAQAVVKASEECGIFQVVNHGIPTELIQRLKEVGIEFFELPEKEKQAVAKPPDSNEVEGYSPGYRGWADHLFHTIWPPSRIKSRFWPKTAPDYREVNEEYGRQIEKLSEKMLGWLSQGLGLRPEALKEGLGGETMEYLMKINYYPPACSSDKLDLSQGAPPHVDYCGITFLIANEVYGLEAFIDNNWIDVKYDTSGIVVLVGEQVVRMSNGKYKTTLHRARTDNEKMRLSWPVFCAPHPDHVVGPLPELINGDNAPKFKPYAYGDFRNRMRKKLPVD